MKREFTGLFLAIGMGCMLSPVGSAAQDVRDFTTGEPTSQELIETLKPQSAPPKAPGTRGLRPVTLDKPECAYYRKQASRGIKLVPDSDAAALKVVFARNSAELSAESSQTLDKLGEALKSEALGPCCFQVEGHTDSQGRAGYNKKLSERRAQSVKNYLKERHNIDADRLLAVGKGKSQPLADNETEEGRQKNRRVQIINLGYGQPTAQ